jgi:hypothetical protein
MRVLQLQIIGKYKKEIINSKMNLKERIDLMAWLGEYMKQNPVEWKDAKKQAFLQNGWFTREFTDLASTNIATYYLNKEALTAWTKHYHLDDNITRRNVGIVMAGNIPMVGFHDLLSVFITGHKQTIKLSTKDDVLIKHLVEKLIEKDSRTETYLTFASNLKGCDAYIATGSNNTSRYFEYYFGRYPNIIRNNKTSVAVLTGTETLSDLENLAGDICNYFGLGCRNVTKLYVPENYDFIPFLNSFGKYKHFSDHKKYRNNYDYYLTLLIMNNQQYMTNNIVLLFDSNDLFSPVSQLNYSIYKDFNALKQELASNSDIQCIAGQGFLPFGTTQLPGLFDYADGIDTVGFLLSL